MDRVLLTALLAAAFLNAPFRAGRVRVAAEWRLALGLGDLRRFFAAEPQLCSSEKTAAGMRTASPPCIVVYTVIYALHRSKDMGKLDT